ncbi:MAG: alpha/beta hydrolase family protein [Acidimicrobiales bacterium]
MQRFFDDAGFNFMTLLALGSSYRGLADIGEVLATIERIPNGDRETWIHEWTATADRLRWAAEQSEKGGHRASARAAFLRASQYYDVASVMAPGTKDPDRFHTLWEQHRQCWDVSLPYWDPAPEKLAIPFEGTTLEAYWFSARRPGADRRPTVILNNGSDGPVIAMWTLGGAAATERGWNAIAFDGPGQGASLHRQSMYFRHDWETVVGPVVDYLLTRDDVDAGAIVLHGVSQAGYWAPRAAAFEPRLAAVVADPGVVDVVSSWLMHFPPGTREMLADEANKDEFDAMVLSGPPEVLGDLHWRMAPYGTSSPFDALRMAMAMHLDDETIAMIRCPTLVTDPDDEQFWPGQSQAMFDTLTCEKELVRFRADEGANWHCEPVAQALRDERIFDWLEGMIGA